MRRTEEEDAQGRGQGHDPGPARGHDQGDAGPGQGAGTGQGLSRVIVVQSRGQSPETVPSLGTGLGPNLGTVPGARTIRTRMDTGTQSQDQSPGQDRGQGPSQQTKYGILEFTQPICHLLQAKIFLV